MIRSLGILFVSAKTNSSDSLCVRSWSRFQRGRSVYSTRILVRIVVLFVATKFILDRAIIEGRWTMTLCGSRCRLSARILSRLLPVSDSRLALPQSRQERENLNHANRRPLKPFNLPASWVSNPSIADTSIFSMHTITGDLLSFIFIAL